MEAVQRPFLDRHVLSTWDCNFTCNVAEPVELKAGFLYEIDHKQLPRKSPIQVEGIRAVLVTAINEFNLSVRVPSTLAMRDYFSNIGFPRGKKYPNLDKQFVMSLKLAKQILARQISPTEFAKQRHLQSFWLLPSNVTESTVISNGHLKDENSTKAICWSSDSPGILRGSTAVSNGHLKDENSRKGICWSSLNCPGVLRWGVRRKISYLGRNTEKTPQVTYFPSTFKEEEKIPQVTYFPSTFKEEDTQTEIKSKDETKRKSRKRKPEGCKQNKKMKARKCEVKKPSSNLSNQLKLSYNWWSQVRYKNAEIKMLEIMKAKGAVFEKPILRQLLRVEARKHIGDTGLLDHVLKHMADKVAPNGEERFRRRHNADGAMVYWLESAELVNVRREAGIKDPYWTPPPGWKPGDSPSQDPNFARELKLLKEEISNMKKDVQELHQLKREDEVDKAILVSTESSSESCNLESDTEVLSLQEDYENLAKRKAKLAQQLAELQNSMLEGSKRNKNLKDAKHEMNKLSSKISEQKLKLCYGRWSHERYKNAEVKMFEIMKAEGATAGKPIVRQALRMEARKHIGDTGLLDHILKHMAEKLAPNGLDRFRRRHNADGAMEYWLENADLVNIRREAGVRDPYWTPPLGWKPGDSPSQGPNYTRELKLLKEEMCQIEKDMQALFLLKRVDDGKKAVVISTKSSSESCNLESDNGVVSFQGDYENLENMESQLEQHTTQISECLNGIQEGVASYRKSPYHPHGIGSASIDLDKYLGFNHVILSVVDH